MSTFAVLHFCFEPLGGSAAECLRLQVVMEFCGDPHVAVCSWARVSETRWCRRGQPATLRLFLNGGVCDHKNSQTHTAQEKERRTENRVPVEEVWRQRRMISNGALCWMFASRCHGHSSRAVCCGWSSSGTNLSRQIWQGVLRSEEQDFHAQNANIRKMHQGSPHSISHRFFCVSVACGGSLIWSVFSRKRNR